MKSKGQVTIFIIIAIVLVSAVVGFFIFKDILFRETIPSSFEPVYTSFLSCLEENTFSGISILESQAGYIYLPEFEPGSTYMPFSSQLDFLGNPIPYWYYVSGNNIQREQVPSKSKMQEQLAQFVDEKIKNCNLKDYSEQGFSISFGEPEASATITDNGVEVNLNMPLDIAKEEDAVKIKSHNIKLDSNLGKLYTTAKIVYDYEQNNLFLEKYAVDILELYAPVTGVEISCSPKTWVLEEVFDDLHDAVEANTLALMTTNSPFKSEESKYFVVDISADEDIRFINSKNWAYSFETISDSPILIANPVGNQAGLGILGFCYVPYHFVYNLKYPVLVQVSDGAETFQFPVAVVVQGNNPREPLDTEAVDVELPELCKHKNSEVNVRIYDSSLKPVDADISFECFGTQCNIGKAEAGVLNSEFPQCVNGYILAKAEGYADTKQIYSSVNSGSVDIIIDKLYNLNVDLKLGGASYDGNAIINFNSDENSRTVVYPEQKSVELAQGQYEVSVYIYKDSELKLEGTTQQQCVESPKSGIKGMLGFTEQKCFDINIPEQIISNVLAGGGKQNYYVLESELAASGIVEINADKLALPTTLEQLQDNYLLFESKGLDINFK